MGRKDARVADAPTESFTVQGGPVEQSPELRFAKRVSRDTSLLYLAPAAALFRQRKLAPHALRRAGAFGVISFLAFAHHGLEVDGPGSKVLHVVDNAWATATAVIEAVSVPPSPVRAFAAGAVALMFVTQRSGLFGEQGSVTQTHAHSAWHVGSSAVATALVFTGRKFPIPKRIPTLHCKK